MIHIRLPEPFRSQLKAVAALCKKSITEYVGDLIIKDLKSLEMKRVNN